jgi:hypothetical protein
MFPVCSPEATTMSVPESTICTACGHTDGAISGLYVIDNEIHHRGQGYRPYAAVGDRAAGILER